MRVILEEEKQFVKVCSDCNRRWLDQYWLRRHQDISKTCKREKVEYDNTNKDLPF